ncbi:helix-turn-helix domain-containing protein, partial [Clostridium sp. YIM B02551]|uniref:helix-turn-helix domain-containing protein n=1 Tax=Clostridium sp. YIM B02551 TaxID=2910679 RepID=UPI001EEAF4BC
MSIYSVELKIKAIEDWRKREISIAEIIKKYNISQQTLTRWVTEYDSQGLEGLVRKPQNKIHTGEFKQVVVEDM